MLLGGIFLVVSCGEECLTSSAYIKRVKKNAAVYKTGMLGQCPYELIFKTPDLLVAQSKESNGLSVSGYQQLRQKYEDAIYVDVNMGRCNEQGEYTLLLVTPFDSIGPSFQYRESNGGVAPYVTDLFIFPDMMKNNDIKFCLKSESFQSVEVIVYDELINLPQLKI